MEFAPDRRLAMTYSPTLSVVVPCYNEEENILRTLGDISAGVSDFPEVIEIVVVDDGSTDLTHKLACEFEAKNLSVRVIRRVENGGIGAAFWEGVSHAQGDLTVMIPGDGENDIREVLRFFDLTTSVDLVIPYIYNADVRSIKRRIVSALYRFIVNFSFGTSFGYTNGTVLYRTGVLQSLDLSSFGFFYQTEILVKLIRRGFLYAEVPHMLGARSKGDSKALTLKSLVTLFLSFLRLFCQIHILRIESREKYAQSYPPNSATYLARERRDQRGD